MKTHYFYATVMAIFLTACGGTTSRDNQQSDTVIQPDSIEYASTGPEATGPATTEPEATEPEAIESIARQIYLFTVLAEEPDYDFLRANCTPGFINRLADANDYDDGGYAIWLLRTGEQDGDGPTGILDVIRVSDNAVRVDYIDLGHVGSTTLHFNKENKIESATRPDEKSIFD